MQLWTKDMVLSMVLQRTLFFKLKTISYIFFNLFIMSFWSIVTIHKYVIDKCIFIILKHHPFLSIKGKLLISPIKYCRPKWMDNYCLKSWPNKSKSMTTSMVVVYVIVWLDNIWWESVYQITYMHLNSEAYKKLLMLI